MPWKELDPNIKLDGEPEETGPAYAELPADLKLDNEPGGILEEGAKATVGLGEAAGQVASGLVGSAAAGVVGARKLLAGESPEAATKEVKRVSEALTYKPQTKWGEFYSKALEYPFEKATQAGKFVGENVQDLLNKSEWTKPIAAPAATAADVITQGALLSPFFRIFKRPKSIVGEREIGASAEERALMPTENDLGTQGLPIEAGRPPAGLLPPGPGNELRGAVPERTLTEGENYPFVSVPNELPPGPRPPKLLQPTSPAPRPSSGPGQVFMKSRFGDIEVVWNAEKNRYEAKPAPEIGLLPAEGETIRAQGETIAPKTETAPAAAGTVTIPERRTNLAQRKRISEMEPEEMKRELLTDPLTGLMNRRAYDEGERMPVQAMVDVDSLKTINDVMGHGSGDQLLAAIGEALRDHTEKSFRISGDEFIVEGSTEEAVSSALEAARGRLQNAIVEYTAPDGTKYTYKGLEFTHGIGKTLQDADAQLLQNKASRESAGLRARRGEPPRGLAQVPAPGREIQRQAAPQEKVVKPPWKLTAEDLVEAKTKDEIVKKLESIFGPEEELLRYDDEGLPEGDRNAAKRYILANKFMADLEHAAIQRDYGETDTLLKAVQKRMQEVEYPPQPEYSEPIPARAAPDQAPDFKSAVIGRGQFPIERIAVSEIEAKPEALQFKLDVNAAGEQKPLAGEWNELAAGNLLLWESKNGKLFVANGHHRLALAKRTKQAYVNAQVLKEADGFTINDARRIAAESNILEGKGTVYDQAEYFRLNAEYTPELAKRKGIAGRGYAIGRLSTDNTYAQFRNRKISPEAAEAISTAAPQNDTLQVAGVKFALEHPKADPAEIENFVHALSVTQEAPVKQGNLFGFNDTAIASAEIQAKAAAARIQIIRDQVNSVRGAAKRPELAAKLGVDVKDPEGVRKRLAELTQDLAKWEKWYSHPELLEEIRKETKTEKPAEPVTPKPVEAIAEGEGLFSFNAKEVKALGLDEHQARILDQIKRENPEEYAKILKGNTAAQVLEWEAKRKGKAEKMNQGGLFGEEKKKGGGQGGLFGNETGAIEIPREDLERAYNRFKEFWAPLSTLPNKKEILTERGQALGGMARAEDIVNKAWKRLDSLSDLSKEQIFKAMSGQVDLADLSRENQHIARFFLNLNDIIGEMLVKRNIITPQQFAAHQGEYIRYMYLKHVLGEDAKMPTRPTGKLDLSYQKSRQDLTWEQRRALGIIEDVSLAEPLGMAKSLTDIVKYDYLEKLATDPRNVWQPSIVEVVDLPREFTQRGAAREATLRMRQGGDVFQPVMIAPDRWILWNQGTMTAVGRKMSIGQLVDEVDLYRRMVREAPNTPEIQGRLNALENALDRAREETGNAPKDFIQMPTSKFWGPLAGAYVRKPIARDLMGFWGTEKGNIPGLAGSIEQMARLDAAATGMFKTAKVALNIPTCARNTVSNFVQLGMSGTSPLDIPKLGIDALTDMINKNPEFTQARRNGLFKTNWSVTELNEVMNVFRKMQGDTWGQIVGKAQGLAKWYGKIDDLFKFMKYLEARKGGADVATAVQEGQKWGMDYSLADPSVKWARKHAIPFLSYQYKIAPLVAESLIKRPWVIGSLAAVPTVMWQLAKQMNRDMTEEDWAELRKSIPMDLKERGTWMLIPVKINGKYRWFDYSYFLPWGNLVAGAQAMKEGNIKGVVGQFGIGGTPAMTLLKTFGVEPLFNDPPKEPFSGQPIYRRLDPPYLKAAKTMEYLANIMAPSMVSRYGALGYSFSVGTEDRWGRQIDMPEAIGRWFGVNLKEANTKVSAAALKAQVKTLQDEYTKIVVDPRISAERKEAYKKRLTEEINELIGKRNK